MRPQKDKCTVSNGEDTVSYTANLYYNLREGHIYNTHMHNDPLFLIFFCYSVSSVPIQQSNSSWRLLKRVVYDTGSTIGPHNVSISSA